MYFSTTFFLQANLLKMTQQEALSSPRTKQSAISVPFTIFYEKSGIRNISGNQQYWLQFPELFRQFTEKRFIPQCCTKINLLNTHMSLFLVSLKSIAKNIHKCVFFINLYPVNSGHFYNTRDPYTTIKMFKKYINCNINTYRFTDQ